MSASLETMYRTHHAKRRGDGFVLLGDERGSFLRETVGKGNHILDIGCRDGALTKYFKEGNTVLGADIDSDALARAKQDIGIDTMHLDLNGEWPFEKNSFDAVVAAEVIEHLYYPEMVIEKIARVLKPKGILAGTVPNPYSLMNRFRYVLKQKRGTPLADPTHINHFTVQELHSILSKHFEKVEIRGLGRLGWLAHMFPQAFAFDLCFVAKKPRI